MANRFLSCWLRFWSEVSLTAVLPSMTAIKYVKHFICWNQLLALTFGQFSNRESLRNLIVAFEAHHSKCYHLWMGKNVSKSSLARENQDRDYHIFEEYAYYLVNEVRKSGLLIFSKLVVTLMLFIRRQLIIAFSLL